jgi:hypothetical protein
MQSFYVSTKQPWLGEPGLDVDTLDTEALTERS